MNEFIDVALGIVFIVCFPVVTAGFIYKLWDTRHQTKSIRVTIGLKSFEYRGGSMNESIEAYKQWAENQK